MALVVIINADPASWNQDGMDFERTLHQILVMLNAHLSLDHSNSVGVIIGTPGVPGEIRTGSQLVYPHHSPPLEMDSTDSGKLVRFRTMNEIVVNKTRTALTRIGTGRTSLAACLTKALCHLNKEKATRAAKSEAADVHFEGRILVITPSSKPADEYIGIMNSIFCAQNKGIRVDACILSGEQPLLQQAASLTGGLYESIGIDQLPNLLQHLLSIFLASDELLSQFNLPRVQSVDFATSCLNNGCNKSISPYGFVCSECLSMFCAKCRPTKKKPNCLNCGAVVVQ